MFYISCFLFFFGAAIGSFVNVVTLRWGTGLSPFRGSSKCFVCGKKLNFYELVPIFSFIFLKGRCHNCHSKFSTQYLLVEIFSGFFCVVSYFLTESVVSFILTFAICQVLLAIFLYDLQHKIIPDSFILSLFFLSLVYQIYNFSSFKFFLSAILVSLPFFLIWFFSSGKLIGFGDIKFMATIGLLLGLKVGLSSIFIAFWIGLAYVIIRFVFDYILRVIGLRIEHKKLTMKSELPFAPFLVIGTLIGFFTKIDLISF